MISGGLRIDQTPCRASYGLLTQSALQEKLTAQARNEVMGSIAQTAVEGNRLAKAYNPANSLPQIASEKYPGEMPDIALVSIDRPIISWQENTGTFVNIFA